MSSNGPAVIDSSECVFDTPGNARPSRSEALEIRTADSPEARASAFAFIRLQFRTHFDAEIADDARVLMTCVDGTGAIVAAWGLRTAADGLFSQHYLDANLLESLGCGEDGCAASEVVELAHLCVAAPKFFPRLVPLLATTLVTLGYRRLVCTATGCLVRYFERRGFRPRVLAPARVARLPAAEQARWGSYYEHAPLVVAGSLGTAAAQQVR